MFPLYFINFINFFVLICLLFQFSLDSLLGDYLKGNLDCGKLGNLVFLVVLLFIVIIGCFSLRILVFGRFILRMLSNIGILMGLYMTGLVFYG